MGVTTGEYYIRYIRFDKPKQSKAIMLVMLGLVCVTLALLAQSQPLDPAVAAMLKHTKTFGVMCPTAEMTNEEHQQWISYVAAKGYPAYPTAGAGCVDP